MKSLVPWKWQDPICCVVGLGNIGRQVVQRAKSMGMQVIGIREHPENGNEGCEAVFTPSHVDTIIRDMDFIVLSAPLTEFTRGFINAARLARMKPTAYLINVSRGPLIEVPPWSLRCAARKLAALRSTSLKKSRFLPIRPTGRSTIASSPRTSPRSRRNLGAPLHLVCGQLAPLHQREGPPRLGGQAAGILARMSSEDILSQIPPPADARIAYGSDPHQFFDLRIPRDPLHSNHRVSSTEVIPGKPEFAARERGRIEGSAFPPVAIVIHGGFWRAKYDLTHAGHLCAALTKAGVATVNLEYRRVGNPGGGWPGSLQDIEAARRFLPELAKKHKVDVGRVIVVGHSAGGHLALALVARQNHLRGVIALAPISDLRRANDLHLSNDAVVEFLGGTPSQVPEHYAEASPIELPVSVPQVIIHGAMTIRSRSR